MSMCQLHGSMSLNDGYDILVTIEDAMRGAARLNVACMLEDQEEIKNSQGIDLTPQECRALAKMLEAVAITVEASAFDTPE